VDAIREVIRRIRAASSAEILLMTGPFGSVDPRDDARWTYDIDPDGKDYRAILLRLARDEKCAFLDMFALWGLYVRESGKDLESFKRDAVHANERGEQILGRILDRHFAPVGKAATPAPPEPSDPGSKRPGVTASVFDPRAAFESARSPDS